MKSKTYQADWLDQVSTSIDLRRSQNTALADTITIRAQHLVGPDQAFVLAMYRDGQTAADIARLVQLDPRQVRRRIRNAITRLNDPTFIFVITHASNWSPTRRKVARALFQAGNSIRQTADSLNLKVHQVRRHRTAILDLYTESNQPHAPAPNRTWQYPKQQYQK
tara:strand:- start:22781 stop:23275 length:495 start_codon:yes stop_codon:yes gene_type:complete